MGKEARVSRLFRSETMDRELRAASAGDSGAGHRVWVLIVLETWLREFDVDPLDSKQSMTHVPESPFASFLSPFAESPVSETSADMVYE